MKSPRSASKRWLIRCLAALLTLAPVAPSLAAPQQISFVGDPWPPYVNGELGNHAESGIAVDIVNHIFARIDGAEPVFPLIPWKRALLEVEHGSSDGIAILQKTPERERYLEYSVPLLEGHSRLWYLDDGDGAVFEWNDHDDLNGRRIGMIDDYSYGPELESRFESGVITAVRGPTVEHLFEMLAAGRVDLVLATDAVGYAVLRKLGNRRIHAVGRSLFSETFYIALSKKSPAVGLLPQIDAAIVELSENGVIDSLVRGGSAD